MNAASCHTKGSKRFNLFNLKMPVALRMYIMAIKLSRFFTWMFTGCVLHGDGAVMSNIWFVDVNDAMENEAPSKVTAKIGDDLKIPCHMDYKLTFFAWKFCQADCLSPTADWAIVVKVDNSTIETFNKSKFGLDPNGSLILKDIQPSNDHNRVRCYYKERYVHMDHRSTIIRVAQESPIFTSKTPKEYVVFENMPFVLVCDARGYPPPWIAWIWKGQVLQNKTNGPKYLLRLRATTEEAGNYTCMAGNSAGITSYNYQVTVRVDGPPGESKAPPQTHSTVERPTVESKATSEAPRESKAPPETLSTVKRPTIESKPTSEAPSAGTTREADQESISLGVSLAIGIPVAIAAVIVVAVLCAIHRRKRRGRAVIIRYQQDSTSVSGDGIDKVEI